jgi:signal transduction histidine kinase
MTHQKAQWIALGAAALAVVGFPLALAALGDRSWLASCIPSQDGQSPARWTRAVSGFLVGSASMAMAAALLRWAPRGRSFGAGWPFVLLAVVLLSAGLAQWFEVMAAWLPDPRVAGSAGYLTTATTGLTAVALFHALPRVWSPPSRTTHEAPVEKASVLNGAGIPASPGQHLHGGSPLKAGAGPRPQVSLETSEDSRNALEEAERASRLKDTFLAMTSHELRTPLQSTLHWAELLRRDGSNPALVADAARHIIHNVKVQSRLIADLLDMSRILTGQLQLDYLPTDAVAAVRSAVDMVQAEAVQRSITVELHAPEGPVHLLTDPCRLEQVAWNLISNAVHASAEGGRVRVSLGADDQRMRLVVQDQGVGIAPHDLPHIFDHFRQGEARAVRHGGLGLGLSIARNIVLQFGGHIGASSDGLGQGACFTVDIPLQPPEEPAL